MSSDSMTWDLAGLQQDFELLGVHGPYVVVRRKEDGQLGTVEFTRPPYTLPPRGAWVTSPPRFRDWRPCEDGS